MTWSNFLKLSTLSGALLAAGISAAAAQTLTKAQIATLNTPDRQAVLIDGARKEGAVAWYSSMVVDQVTKPLSEAFEKKYPFIKTTYLAIPSAQIVQRSLVESRANAVKVDIMAAAAADQQRGTNVTQKFWSPMLAEYPKEVIDPEGTWVSFRTTWTAVAWNTSRIKAADAPKTWEDLANPKYKGMMAWTYLIASGAPRIITHYRSMMGEERAMEFLKKLRAQDIRTIAGDTGAAQAQLISGEIAMIVGHPLALVATAKEEKAPIDGANLDPAITRMSAVAMLRDPPHPYAAALFMDWILDKDGGQKVLADVGYNPAHPKVPALESLRWVVPATTGMKEIVLSTDKENDMLARSSEIYRELFR